MYNYMFCTHCKTFYNLYMYVLASIIFFIKISFLVVKIYLNLRTVFLKRAVMIFS